MENPIIRLLAQRLIANMMQQGQNIDFGALPAVPDAPALDVNPVDLTQANVSPSKPSSASGLTYASIGPATGREIPGDKSLTMLEAWPMWEANRKRSAMTRQAAMARNRRETEDIVRRGK